MVTVRERVPLAPRCTLELGGPAEFLAEAVSAEEVVEALHWAEARKFPVHILGCGSNVVVADAGVPGLVVHMAGRGRSVVRRGDEFSLVARAGEPWDDLVEWTASEGWAGLEYLSGIPGSVGATPIQNVGAYGREVAEVIRQVEVLDRRTRQTRTLNVSECGFGYRDSRFRRRPDEFVVLAVTFALRPGPATLPTHEDIVEFLGHPTAPPSPTDVRQAVLAVRRRKSMVLDSQDSNRRSVGSFFLNPVVEESRGREAAARAVTAGLIKRAEELRLFRAGGGMVKLSAAWLVERSGFPRGTRRGAVGVSSNHALALVHHGGGSTAELLALAGEIRIAVAARFGITLEPEPAFWGFPSGDPLAR